MSMPVEHIDLLLLSHFITNLEVYLGYLEEKPVSKLMS